MEIRIRAILENEVELFSSILKEAAQWLIHQKMEMWSNEQLSVQALLQQYRTKEMYIGYCDHRPAAAMILQEEDPLFWPEQTEQDTLFLHKLAVCRKWAKSGLSQEMIREAKVRAKQLDKEYVRLDCAADRTKLCGFYEKEGFKKVREGLMFGKYPTAFYEYKLVNLNFE